MKHKTSTLLYQYWNELRGGRKAPSRFEVEPVNIGIILSQTFILEYVDAQTIRFRLAGTKICEQFGHEFRGINFLDLWTDTDRIGFQRQFANINAHAAIGLSTITGTITNGSTAQFEVLILPLTHNGSQITRFLGAISVADAPAWLNHEQIVSQSVTRQDLIWPDGRSDEMPKTEIFKSQGPANNPQHGRVVSFNRRKFRVYEGGLAESPASISVSPPPHVPKSPPKSN